MKYTKYVVISIIIAAVVGFISYSNYRFKNKAEHVVLRVGISPDCPPFDLTENGKIAGIDVDILDNISEHTGIRFHLEEMSFTSVIGAVSSNKVDLAISCISISDERKRNMDFSEAYAFSEYAIIFDKTKEIFTVNDLIGKTVAVQSGTVGEDYLRKFNKKIKSKKESDKIKIVSIGNTHLALEMLLHKKVDTAFMTKEQAEVFVAKEKHLKIAVVEMRENGIAIAFPKGSKYVDVFNKEIKRMHQDGSIEKIVNKWKEKSQNVAENITNTETEKNYFKALLWIVGGIYNTLQCTAAAMLLGSILSIGIVALKMSNIYILRAISTLYVSIFRGTPLLLQLSCIYFGLPALIKADISSFNAGIITFSLNSAAYLAEIIRGGVKSIDKGQIEAALSLNLSKKQLWLDIMAPQVLRNIVPSLINEFIVLSKESSLLSVLGFQELTKRANIVMSEYYAYFLPLLTAGLVYYVISCTLAAVGRLYESKVKY